MKRPSDESDAHRAQRSKKRNIRNSQSSGGGVNATNIGIVIGVGRENEGDDLRLALKAFGKHRTHWPVNLAAGQDFALAHAAFALDEAAWETSTGIGVFAVIDGEREKIDALAGFGIGGGGGENNVFTKAYQGGTTRLFGIFSGFKCEGFPACDFDGNFCGFSRHRSSFGGRTYGGRVYAKVRSPHGRAYARAAVGNALC